MDVLRPSFDAKPTANKSRKTRKEKPKPTEKANPAINEKGRWKADVIDSSRETQQRSNNQDNLFKNLKKKSLKSRELDR